MVDASESIDLAELERLAKAATPGPWTTTQAADAETTTWIEHPLGDVLNHDERGHGHMRENFSWMRRADAEFIAATDPQAILALVARVREAEARIEKVVSLRDRMEQQRDDIDESVRLSTILADLNAALTEGDGQ